MLLASCGNEIYIVSEEQIIALDMMALYMWFLQARCGLLFTIINHNHNRQMQKTATIPTNATNAMSKR